MYLSGRFDMREVERTVQRLIRDGSRLDHKHPNIVFFKILILLEVHITQFWVNMQKNHPYHRK
jgi:hypothetical protein